jgi:hypothetical protein
MIRRKEKRAREERLEEVKLGEDEIDGFFGEEGIGLSIEITEGFTEFLRFKFMFFGLDFMEGSFYLGGLDSIVRIDKFLDDSGDCIEVS